MAITYTSNKNIQLPALNDLNWNVPLNENLTELDQLAGSSFPISIGLGTTVALTSATAVVSSVYWWTAQQLVVTATGNLTANAIITLPANITGSGSMGGSWVIINDITTVQSQTAFSITALPASGSSAFTIGTTSPIAGTIVVLSTTGVLPGGFSTNVEYYVVSPVGTTFSLAATSGGVAITATSTSPTLGTAFATAQYTLTVKPASGTGVIIKPEKQAIIFYDGTKVEYSDTNLLTQLDTIDGTLTVNGAATFNSTADFIDKIGLNGSYGTSGQILTSGGASAAPSWSSVASATGQLIRAPQIKISGTSYTTPAGCTAIYVELVGGGGGGGGSDTTSSNTDIAAGAGGGGGGYGASYISVSASTPYTIAIGAGGTAGSTSGGTGGTGGTTSIIVGATTYSASGGTGGEGADGTNVSSSNDNKMSVGGLGGAGGSATNTTLNLSGGCGQNSSVVKVQSIAATSSDVTDVTHSMVSGGGGSSYFGGGARGQITVGTAGSAASQGGGGGSGSIVTLSSGLAGGAGGAGIIRIWEYT